LADVHLLLQVPIQERGLHVHMVDLPPFLSRQCEEYAYRLHARDRGKEFLEINPLLLHKSARNQPSFMHDDLPCFVPLKFVHPHKGDGTMTMRQVHHLPCLMESIFSCIAARHATSCSTSTKVHGSPVLARFSSSMRLRASHPDTGSLMPTMLSQVWYYMGVSLCTASNLSSSSSSGVTNSGGVAAAPAGPTTNCGLDAVTCVNGGVAGVLGARGDADLTAIAAPESPV
jgi:hypothetical protein